MKHEKQHIWPCFAKVSPSQTSPEGPPDVHNMLIYIFVQITDGTLKIYMASLFCYFLLVLMPKQKTSINIGQDVLVRPLYISCVNCFWQNSKWKVFDWSEFLPQIVWDDEEEALYRWFKHWKKCLWQIWDWFGWNYSNSLNKLFDLLKL